METNAEQDAAATTGGKLTSIALRVAHNPLQIRVLSMAVIFGAWYAAFSMPIRERIDDTVRRSERDRKRVSQAVEVERLRIEVARFRHRLPVKSDPNEWVQYVLGGVRRLPLRVVMLDTEGARDVGPYKAIVVKMQVEGGFIDVDALLRWFEGNERLLRIDELRLEPSRQSDGKIIASMVILGVTG